MKGGYMMQCLKGGYEEKVIRKQKLKEERVYRY